MELHLGTTEIIGFVTAVLLTLVGALRYIFKLWKDQQEGRIAELKKERDSIEAELKIERDNYRSISKDAVRIMNAAVARLPEEEGKPKVKVVVPVTPEHSSPPTRQQESTALQATMRAHITAAALQMDIPPREDDKTKAKEVQVPVSEADDIDLDGLDNTEPLVSKSAAVEAVLKLPSVSQAAPAEENKE